MHNLVGTRIPKLLAFKLALLEQSFRKRIDPILAPREFVGFCKNLMYRILIPKDFLEWPQNKRGDLFFAGL